MGRHIPGGFAQYVRDLAGFLRSDTRTDAELLAAFADGGDQAAFTALVARHGSAVWAACARVLREPADAEDAFQATFIALARRSRAVRPESLAGWLARVAHDAALNAGRAARRRDAAHRRLCERVTQRPEGPPPGDEELQAAVREELAALPLRLRAPLSLYYLEGKTQPEVGRILGMSQQVVSHRLKRGLDALRERLGRRGLAVTTAALVAVLGGVPVALAVPPGLVSATAATALDAAAGGPATTAAARLALELTQAAGRGRLKLYGLLVVAAAGAAVGGAVCLQPGRAAGPAAAAVPLAVRAPIPPPTPGRDRFGNPLPEGAVARLGTLRFWSEGGAADAARSADGTVLVTADGKGGVSFWTPEGRVRERVDGPDQARWVSLSPDAKRLAAAGASEVWVWELEPAGPHLAWTWEADTAGADRRAKHELTALAFTPDGRAVACGDGWAGKTQLLDADSGKSLHTLEGAAWPPLCFTTDGKTLAATLPEPNGTSRARAAVWDIASGRRKALDYPGGGAVADLDLSPDGKRLAWTGRDHAVRVCDPATGREVANWPADSLAPVLAFEPGGRCLAELGAGRVVYRDPDTGKEARRPAAAPSAWFRFTLNGGREGKRVAAGGKSLTLTTGGGVATLDVATGREVGPAGRLYDAPRALAFSPDGRRVISLSGPNDVRSWDADTGRPAGRLSFDGANLVHDMSGFGPDGTARVVCLLPSGEGWGTMGFGVSRWDGRTPTAGEATTRLTPKGAFAVSPDGRWAAGADDAAGAAVVLGDPAGKEVRRLKPTPGGVVRSLVFSADGRALLAYQSQVPAVEVWDVETGRARRPQPVEIPNCSAVPVLAPDGRRVAAITRERVDSGPLLPGVRPLVQYRHEIVVLDVASGKPVWRLPAADGFPGCVAFAPDGHTLAVGHANGAVAVWDLATGREERRFTGHRAAVRALAFSPAGRLLVSGSADCTGLVWDVSGPAGRPGR